MQCRCGYRFNFTRNQSTREFRTYALVDDEQWVRVMDLEQELLQVEDEDRQAELNSVIGRLVGSVIACPQCQRIIIQHDDIKTIYAVES